MSDAPPGYIWLTSGRNMRLVSTGGVDADAEVKRLAEHNAAWRAADAEREQVQARETLIASRAKPFLESMPSDRQLGIDVGDASPARVALLRCLGWITFAEAQHAGAIERQADHMAAVARLERATADLEALQSAVRSEFKDYLAGGRGGDRPPSRSAERECLLGVVSGAQWEADLSASAADGLDVLVAERVVAELQGRLPGSRGAVLVEQAEPIAAEIRRHSEALRQAYGVMAALGETTAGAVLKSGKITLPSLPHGKPFTVDVAADPAAVDAWHRAIVDLTEDPNAAVTVPHDAASEGETDAPRLSWGAIRAAWRGR